MRTILRAFTLGLSLLSFHAAVFSQQVAKKISYPASPDGVIGFLEFRPSDYGSQKHPLIIFLHGVGERGNGTSQIGVVAYNALPLYCANGATMRFTVGGQTSSFVVLSPQLSTQYGYWPTYYVKEMINYAKANLQIDPNRIYVTGLSLGGGGVWRLITDTENGDNTFDANIAAVAPICGTQEENDYNYCNTVAANHLPIWAFHSMDDINVSVGATQHAEMLSKNCGMTPASKFTYYLVGGHSGAWVNGYDTGHITRTVSANGGVSNFTASPNLYEWFLTQTRSTNQTNYTAPAVNAGLAQSITLPLNAVTLTGSGTGTNGASISSYSWTKTSGPAAGVINLPLVNTTLVTGLVQGVYVFTLTVTDNHGLSSSSSVTITVNPLYNQPPVSNAGSDVTITLPTNSVSLDASASYDPDGSIVAYYWVQKSGPSSYNIADVTAAKTTVSNLVAGVYVFTLQVRDNAGTIGYSTKTITVNQSFAAPVIPTNQTPISNAGPDVTINFPTNSVSLDAGASYDADGTIVEYYWTMVSGPSGYYIANPFGSKGVLSNLVAGVYVLVLQVKDNAGGMGYSTKTITVNQSFAAPVIPTNQTPISNAGPDVTINLPTNSVSLDAGASYDADGAIVEYYWAMVSGPSGYSIANPFASTVTLGNLVKGVYVLVLQVKDNAGAMGYSTKTITVNQAFAGQAIPGNQTPISYAGPDVTITLPTNSVSLDASASYDPDGSIVAYYWVQNAGPSSYSIADVSAAKTTVSNLVPGIYVFTLQVRDNAGIIGYSTKTITVNAAGSATTNQPIGYIKLSYGPYQACDDASSAGRIPIYGESIANGSFVYADAAMTQKYDGGWNWYSFTPVLGGTVTQAFAIYPVGSIGLLTSCTAGARMAVTQQEKTITPQQAALSVTPNAIAGAVTAGKLSMYPNPVQTMSTIELTSAGNSVKTINLYNSNGILKAKYTWQIIKGNNTFSLKNVSGLTSGLYIIDVRDSNGKPNGKLKFIKM